MTAIWSSSGILDSTAFLNLLAIGPQYLSMPVALTAMMATRAATPSQASFFSMVVLVRFLRGSAASAGADCTADESPVTPGYSPRARPDFIHPGGCTARVEKKLRRKL